jgi:hypothetical protein
MKTAFLIAPMRVEWLGFGVFPFPAPPLPPTKPGETWELDHRADVHIADQTKDQRSNGVGS